MFRPQAPLTPSNWSALYRGRSSPVMSWILLKANNGQEASGMGDKRFLRFKRNAFHLWTAIIRHRLNNITHQQVMRFNQGSKFANIFKAHIKHPQCFGTLAQSAHFLWNTPIMTQWVFTGPARVEWLWVNDFGSNEYHIWHGWPNTCWHVENKSPKYEVPIFTAQTRNHWRKSKGCASVPKNGLSNHRGSKREKWRASVYVYIKGTNSIQYLSPHGQGFCSLISYSDNVSQLFYVICKVNNIFI